MYTHILIATDGSALAGKGLDAGLALAAALKARATLVTASDPWQAMMAAEPSGLALGAELREEQRRQKEAQARAILDEGRERAARAGIELETVYVPECPADEAILETATKIGADLIVMASHGHRGLRKLLLGSQTQAVVSRGHLPVLVVR
ncbi:universal stress protein [Luteimonas wenzhouensis]|jgi:nucleotide-binding universal stress UspA family protein|uniref:Universal stress protein n=1 Tax=Luteimonas wenzhouensis TaxID=2599615 RepID=A0A5C5U0S5_9GAMM|nr:universal stress protein [Luteimonas wenzhouensis]NLW97166.1 universal stress protein [Xanthomonadaceae bacterium]TWT19506.1 universal stress protein [Luteimonas wenzhouensis]